MAKKDKEKMLFAGIRKGIIDTNRICKEVEIYTDGYKLYLKYERNPDTCAVCGEHTHSRILCNGKPVCRQCMMKMKEWSENYQTQKIHLLDIRSVVDQFSPSKNGRHRLCVSSFIEW